MLIGKNVRRVSHNLVISKYFEEENSQIQNQYFIRNVADELSVISLGFGGFFAVINPCSFDIEYSSDTFKNMNDINLVEVEKFESKAATVFRIGGLTEMPEFDFEYIKSTLSDKQQLAELELSIESNTGANDQYSLEQGSLGTSFDTIELNIDALNAANYKHVASEEYKNIAVDEEADELATEIARRKQELEKLNQELATSSVKLKEVEEQVEVKTEILEAVEEQVSTTAKEGNVDELELEAFASALDSINDFLNPDDLFADLEAKLEQELGEEEEDV